MFIAEYQRLEGSDLVVRGGGAVTAEVAQRPRGSKRPLEDRVHGAINRDEETREGGEIESESETSPRVRPHVMHDAVRFNIICSIFY